ncbi:hypothetical protein RP726_02705 [Candidatus Methylospira mobilis]|nr:hypothetical protein [Candidatus Methylospira mobilis]WNV05332.1 hypothetical protein RP726_02705 [Candidatus Methylospira mobilis]
MVEFTHRNAQKPPEQAIIRIKNDNTDLFDTGPAVNVILRELDIAPRLQ